MRKHINTFKNFLNENVNNDYYKSKYRILVGTKTNLFKDMKDRYECQTKGDEIYYFDNGYHFATLYKEGSFYVLKYDGSLDEYGWRK